MKKSSRERDSEFAIVAAFLVLISALLDPRLTFLIASAFLVIFILYKVFEKRK